jgi:hypothetical protein
MLQFLSGVGKALADKAFGLIAVGAFGALAIVGGLLWAGSTSIVRTFIVETVVTELGQKNDRLSAPLAQVMKDLRATEVGALNVGNFKLTPTNNSYTLFLYFPDNYSGQLALRIAGYASDEKWVEVQPDGQKAFPINSTDPIYKLQDYLTPLSELQKNRFNDFTFVPGIMQDLRSLTFQLSGPNVTQGSPKFDPTATITVTYVALIQPVIQWK